MKHSPAVFLVVGLLGIVVGLGLGLLLGGGGDSDRSTTAHAAIAAGAPAARGAVDADARLVTPALVGLSVERGDGDAVDEATVQRAAARAVARVSVRDAVARAAGAGVLRATVETFSGEPLPDVTVVIVPRSTTRSWRDASSTSGAPPDRAVETALEREARRRLEDAQGERVARTGLDGVAQFDALPDATWEIDAYAEGWTVRPRFERLSRVPTGATVAFVADPLAAVRVEVVDRAGQPVDEAVVQVREFGQATEVETVFRWRPGDDRVHLAAGDYEFEAFDGVVAALGSRQVLAAASASAAERVKLLDVAGERSVRLVLAAGNGIWGHVSFERPPGSNAWPRIALLPLGDDVDPESITDLGTVEPIALDGGTVYGFDGVEPGRYLLAVTVAWGGEVVGRSVVDFAGGLLRHDFAVTAGEGADDRLLRFQVLTPDGAPVASIQWGVRESRGRGSRSTSGVSSTFRGGWHELELPAGFDLPTAGDGGAVETSVDVTAKLWGTERVALEPGVRDYTVQFVAPATLVATVAGADNLPPGAHLALELSPSSEGGRRRGLRGNSARVGPDGRVEVGPLAPGRYDLELQVEVTERGGWGSSRTSLVELELDLGVGENTVALAAPRLYRLEVELPDGGDRRPVQIERIDAQPVAAMSFRGDVRDGVAVFAAVPAGSYSMANPADEGEVMTLTVPPTRAVFAGSRIRALEVSIEDPAGRLAAVGLRSGDRVVGLQGGTLADGQSAQQVRAALWARSGAFTLLVERGGGVEEVQFEASAVEPRSWGGALEAVTD